jgi:4-amino-4-deoxy-L-arabinose transferase-like glycosyltransferase
VTEPLRRRLGRLALPRPLVALVAASLVLAAAWAFVVPPFQAPDEDAHVAYAQVLAERLDLPGDDAREPVSSEQSLAADASNATTARAQLDARTEWNRRAYQRWRARALALPERAREDGGGPNPASVNPPLYYLAEAGAYRLSGGDFFDRLLAMRMLSLLWLVLTVSAAWLLAGEVLGRDRVLQLAAAATVGLAPMLTFVSASVSPDAMLWAAWTLSLWLGVRILKRGITTGRAFALLAAVGLAILAKATSYALVPAAMFVLAVGLVRRRPPRRAVVAIVASASGALLATAGVWFLVAGRAGLPAAEQLREATSGVPLNVRELVSYVWQFYLPRLPFQTDYPTVAATLPVYDIWIKGAWAAFGWTEVVFPEAVYAFLTAVTVLVAGVTGVALWRRRGSHDPAVGAFLALTVLALLAGLHWSEYRILERGGVNFNQGRYLLPLAGIAGLAVAHAVRQLSAPLRPIGAAVVVGGLFVLQVLSLGLVLERFHA